MTAGPGPRPLSGRGAAGGRGEPGPRTPVVAIIGGGIAGLAAAYALRDAGVAVTVLEGSPRLGGKLAVSPVAGIDVDAGAEALLARRPEGVGLLAELGLDGERRQPGTTSAGIWTRGQVRPLPRRQFMGVPAEPAELAATGLLSAEGLTRAAADAELPAAPADGADASVTDRVGARMGREVVDRLVEPLLGGVYAGRCEDLSFQATLAPLAAAAPRFPSLGQAVASLLPPAPAAPARAAPAMSGSSPSGSSSSGSGPSGADAAPPVFTTLAGGLGSLPPLLAEASGAEVRTESTVRELVRTAAGWRLTIGSAHAPQWLDADAVILALPARPASRLLAGTSPAAAAALAEIRYASMAVITLAYPDAAFPAPPAGSGFLVPAIDGRAIKAVTYSTAKWPHLRRSATGQQAGLQLVRCSVGRLGDEAILQRDDAELAGLAAADLAVAAGVPASQLVDVRVTRWGGGLPQYSVGHLGRVARIRAGVAAEPGLAVCGAAYDGVGIPACIASARLAASQVLAHLAGPAARS
jgi:protoporphyrinogen/coproporphyrinogen III oxidase